VQPRLEGADREAQDDRGLGIREPQVVVDDEHGAMLGGQATEAALQLVAQRGLGLHIAASAVGHRHPDLDELSSPDPSGLPVAGVDEQAVQPRIEAVRVADRPDVQPGCSQRLLDGIS
jgi:hypothetical protein